SPRINFIAIAKVIRCPRSVKYDELSELFFSFQHMAQSGTKRRHTGPHRNENQISLLLLIECKTMPCDSDEFQGLALMHIVKNLAGSNLLLNQNLEFHIIRCAGEGKVPLLIIRNLEYRHLAWRKTNTVMSGRTVGSEIERFSQVCLMTNSSDD